MTRLALLMLPLLVAGCARDVVLKPAATRFSADAGTAVVAATAQYDAAIVAVNADVGRFLVANPECGLSDPIVRRDRAMADPAVAAALARAGLKGGTSVCLSAAERAAIDRADLDLPPTPLPLVSRRDFAPQFEALLLISDYVAFLAEHADQPDADAGPRIRSLSAAMQAFSGGLAATITATGGNSTVPGLFASGGPAAQFLGHFGTLAGLVEGMAAQAHDVRALETKIRTDTPAISKAIAELAVSADRWSCAIHMGHRQRFAEQTADWNQNFAQLAEADRARLAERWVAMRTKPADRACQQLTADPPPAPQSAVGRMMIALGDSATDLNRIALRQYTPRERQRMVEATLERLGAVMQAVAKVATPLF